MSEPPPDAILLQATAFTHQGAVRARNEDTVAVGDWVMSRPMDQPRILERIVEAPIVCLVADGMGGHAAGDIASRFVAECLAERAAEATDSASLAELMRMVDRGLFEQMDEQPALLGMGTTVAGLHVCPRGLSAFNVGDSRTYRIEATGLVQLSTDDTPGPKTADGRTALRKTPIMSQALGGHRPAEDFVPHVLEEPIDDHHYLICSDGVTDLLDVGTMFDLITDDDAQTATALFDESMAAGGHDNISIVLVRIRRA
ncbi:MAG: PP2C family serine/threonine-protein phosphatase [Pseudomonadota bacterium]